MCEPASEGMWNGEFIKFIKFIKKRWITQEGGKCISSGTRKKKKKIKKYSRSRKLPGDLTCYCKVIKVTGQYMLG